MQWYNIILTLFDLRLLILLQYRPIFNELKSSMRKEPHHDRIYHVDAPRKNKEDF